MFIIKKVNNHWEVFDGETWQTYESRFMDLNEVIMNLDPLAEYISIETEYLK